MALLAPTRALGCHLCSLSSRAVRRPLLLSSQHPAVRNMSSSADEVLFGQEGHAGLVTMNRPKALNSLNLNMVRLMYDRLKEWKTNDAVKLVILEGAGEKAFCAGGDIR